MIGISKETGRPKCVVIGGGTGTCSVLRGLRQYPIDLTAVVTMADDGGSSGRLRDSFGHLPPGDLRRCLVALSADERVNQVMRTLFEYRFEQGDGLNGHSFGNLMLTALTEITGTLEEAIAAASHLLNVRGAVLPVTTTNVRLGAELADGSVLWGESNIDVRTDNPEIPIRRVMLSDHAAAYPPAVEAITDADLIVIGPGDLYTSLIPNLLVSGIPEAIAASRAKRLYVCNLMTKHGETDGFTASKFIGEVARYLAPNSIDIAIVSNTAISLADRRRYELEQAVPVSLDMEACARLVPAVVDADLALPELVRHDPSKLAKSIISAAMPEISQAQGGRADSKSAVLANHWSGARHGWARE